MNSDEDSNRNYSGFWADIPKLTLIIAVFISFPFLSDEFLFFGPGPFDSIESWDYEAAYEALPLIGKIWNQTIIFLFLYGLTLFLAWHFPRFIFALIAFGLIVLHFELLDSRDFYNFGRDLREFQGWSAIFNWTVMTKFYPIWIGLGLCAGLFVGWLWSFIKRHDIFR